MIMPKVMRAAILTKLHHPLEIADINLPSELSVGQVLVKIFYSGICGSQIGEIDGVKGRDDYLPHLLGHEASGEVIEIGIGVKNVSIGDFVVLHWKPGAGINAEPPKYHWNGRVVNAGLVTTFSNYSIVSENRVTKISKDSDLRVAALFGCAVTTGFGVIENNAKVKIGESVLVYGAGGVGLNMIQAASLVSASEIIAVDRFQNRLDLAKEMGATHTLIADELIEENLKRLIPKGLDVFIDNTGVPDVIEMGYRITKEKGRVILVGVPKNGVNISIYSLPLHFGKMLTGSHGGGTLPEESIERYYNLYRQGKFNLRKLITDNYTLENINHAIGDMRNGLIAGRCMISMD